MIQLCFKLQNIFLQFLLFFLISFSNYKTVGTEQYAQQKYGKLLFSLISLLAIFFFTCDYYTAIDFIWSVKNGYSYIITFHWIRQYFWGLLLSSYFRVSSHIPPAFYWIKKKKKRRNYWGSSGANENFPQISRPRFYPISVTSKSGGVTICELYVSILQKTFLMRISCKYPQPEIQRLVVVYG